jgi:hypothetical protein
MVALTDLKRMTQWFKAVTTPAVVAGSEDSGSVSLLDFNPSWHGDHWQNLLSCPMDARRYVVEEWAMPVQREFDDPAPHLAEEPSEV